MFWVRSVCSQVEGLPSRQVQRGGNGKVQPTTSLAPTSHPTQQGNSSGTGGGQCQNMLYALQDHKGSPQVVTGTLRVFDFDV